MDLSNSFVKIQQINLNLNNKKIKEHQNRVIQKTFDLFEKAIKLESFINSSNYENLEGEEKKILFEQLDLMKKYYEILRYRIGLFKQ